MINNSRLVFPDDYIIHTNRLILRPPNEDDVGELWPYVTDRRITDYLAWDPHPNKEFTKDFIKSLCSAQLSEKGYHWLICFNEKVIGLISLIDVKRKHRSWLINRAEISYWLGPDYQGHGFVTEAGKAVLLFSFEKLKFNKIILGHAEENLASEKVALRLGFKQYAIERMAFMKNNVWHSLKWYDLLYNEI